MLCPYGNVFLGVEKHRRKAIKDVDVRDLIWIWDHLRRLVATGTRSH